MATSTTKQGKAAPALVEAVVVLRPLAGDSLPSPAQSKKMASAVLHSATEKTGLQPASSSIFENLHSFSVRASTEFIDALARCKEVAQVLPNDAAAPELIAPVRKRPATL
ncbi:hypothetical protein LJR289_002382 [Pseudoduganella sp. LjRoot289]|uniref:hypothetical protein n=1 Tax=Pseudoduganella sp. LjRoot289 TaxID=3342314 RepID=UPI003ED138C7